MRPAGLFTVSSAWMSSGVPLKRRDINCHTGMHRCAGGHFGDRGQLAAEHDRGDDRVPNISAGAPSPFMTPLLYRFSWRILHASELPSCVIAAAVYQIPSILDLAFVRRALRSRQ